MYVEIKPTNVRGLLGRRRGGRETTPDKREGTPEGTFLDSTVGGTERERELNIV